MKNNSDNINLFYKKISNFCAYRERCTSEVIEKLKSLNCNSAYYDKILQELYKDNFVNNERYAKLFANSKFNVNKWGKLKIANALYQKKISNEIISSAIDTINNDNYLKTLTFIIEKKIKDLNITKFEDIEIIKLQNYASQKGYETELIIKIISKFKSNKP